MHLLKRTRRKRMSDLVSPGARHRVLCSQGSEEQVNIMPDEIDDNGLPIYCTVLGPTELAAILDRVDAR